ncbi:MAG: HlyC/CorC family transporter [Limnochordales bacterium]|nr:HlyC/CorC family transporter [Limnochordales bacterium]
MADEVPLSTLLALLTLLVFSSFFSASETALMSINRLRLRHRAEEGDHSARRMLEMLTNPSRLISAILIGNNLVNIAASALATDAALRLFGPAGTGIATAAMTVLIITFGEVLPKTLAVHYSEVIAFFVAPLVRAVMWLLAPLVWFFTALGNAAVRLVGKRGAESSHPNHPVTLGEIRTIVSVGGETGALDEEQESMLTGVVDLEETEVQQIFVPRTRIVSISRHATVREAAELLAQYGFSKLPVYDEEPDNFVGVVFGQQILKALLSGQEDIQVGTLLRPVLTVPETMKARRLLEEMRRSGCTVAIAVDEFGTTSGMVTFHDLVGEVLGEIPGPGKPASDEELKQIDEFTWEASGETTVRHLNRELDLELPEEETVTVGGLVFHRLGRLPRPGDEVEVEGVKLQVLEVAERRVRRLRLLLPRPSDPGSESNP